ncbi:MAG: hypothetical protein K0Q84_1966, partial [Arthrobacter sp.]|nr:hypothetical protein [Arthrobacter sp.]
RESARAERRRAVADQYLRARFRIPNRASKVKRLIWMGQPIRRVLCLPFRCRKGSDGHPSTSTVAGTLQRPTRTLGRAALKRVLSGLAPGGVYLAFPVTREAGGLLHHRFTLTCFVPLSNRRDPGGLFSVALACGLPRVGVTHHPALRSPDVPRATCVTRGRLAVPSASSLPARAHHHGAGSIGRC